MTTRDNGAASSSRGSLVNDPHVRGIFFQLLLVAVLVTVGYVIVTNTIANLQRQKIASGFGFLDRIAGFGTSQSLINYSETSTFGDALLVGFLNTLLVAVIGILCATILGFLIGVARL